jgi:hypothetical protein
MSIASIEFRALDSLQINLSEARQAEKDFGLTLAPEAAERVAVMRWPNRPTC